jgi:hypothetical protein
MSSPASNPPMWLAPAFRWLTVVNALLIVVQAFLASDSVWGGNPDMKSVHGGVGNLVFLTMVAQLVVAYLLSKDGSLPRAALVMSAIVAVLVIAQIGLGYSTRDNVKLAVYHVTNGVLLMGLSGMLISMAWNRASGASRG